MIGRPRRRRRVATVAGCLLALAACRNQTAPPAGSEGRTPASTPDGDAAGASGPIAAVDAAGPGAPAAADAPGDPPPPRGCAPAEAKRIPTAPDPDPEPPTVGEALGGAEAVPAALPVTLETTLGTLECVLDARGVPGLVANFVGLARGTRPWWDPCRGAWVSEPFYDGLRFHELVPGFKAQAGCPIGDGTGGPGYAVADPPAGDRRHDAAGVLSMANLGPGTTGSQFFVTLGPAPQLDRRFVPFGRCGPDELLAKLDQAARDGAEVTIRRVRVP